MAGGPGRHEVLRGLDLPPGAEQEAAPCRLGQLRQDRRPRRAAGHQAAHQGVVQDRDSAADIDVSAANSGDFAGCQAAACAERHQGQAIPPGLAGQMSRPGSQTSQLGRSIGWLWPARRGDPYGRCLAALYPHECLACAAQPGPVGLDRGAVQAGAAGEHERVDRLRPQPCSRLWGQALLVGPDGQAPNSMQKPPCLVAGGRCGSRHRCADLLSNRVPPLGRQPGLVGADPVGNLRAQCHRPTPPAGQAASEGVEVDLHGKECICMVGGMNRRKPPRELATDPETWPDGHLADPGAAAVQHIARALAAAVAERGLSLRGVADACGVNRQAIADLIHGRSWPDVATVARLAVGLGLPLWPQTGVFEREMGHEASIPARYRTNSDRA
ncbi:helix-turn-helix domain-containing protein [Streptomyces sp. NPDC006012]|uniref:helix-turn-helix domain-containing protein n=1 Tax=Streptomyces sp. NPDC006012 TaxID=3364739 RepID=UPI00369AB037